MCAQRGFDHAEDLGRRSIATRRNGVKEDGDEHAANSLYLPRRYLDTRRRKHCRARRWRRGLSGCARHIPRRLRTLARYTHHLAAGRTSDRGQPAPARGVESIKSTTLREVKRKPRATGASSCTSCLGESRTRFLDALISISKQKLFK